jgi:hypothetical protein
VPNCVAYEVESEDGTLHIEIESAGRIRAGQELFLDYRLDTGGGGGAGYACRCGAAGCRGTMLGGQAD